MKKTEQLYVIRKYIYANSPEDAAKKDKTTPPKDIIVIGEK